MRISNLRWWIAGLLAAATALNYLDRQSLPVVITEVQKTIPITDQQYANLQMLFLLAYGVMYAGGGRIMDWLGTRLGYAIMIIWWSAATVLHGLVNSAFGLGAARFLLGLGEGGGFPGSAKAVSEWFPPKERSFAFGIFNTGSSVGAVIAPPLIAAVVLWLGWRWVFFLTGAAGILWAVIWLFVYDLPGRHKLITAAERDYLKSSRPLDFVDEGPAPRWIELFRFRKVWGLLGAKFLSDCAWYFFIFWLPKYLGDVRGLDIKQIGYYAWIPYAFAGAGSFIGGWLSSFLIRRGFSINRSRKVTLAISAAIMPVSLLITASPLSLAIVFFSMALFGHQFWSTIMQTLAVDMFPSKVVGSVSGLMGAVGSFGAMLFSGLVGMLLTHYQSYTPVFLIAGLMHPASFLIILLLVGKIEPVKVTSEVKS
ncbi:MAG TPA: MFS transporter [Bryobacteraceae bacterium]|nr:MFS transporter [Bryobacteraceae bacterium]HOL70464.1 MFS transporter [Bryobacteraceae bacterium]HOQ46989.1 MFS transporter [Bryobacteraceae bacterium]HPQ15890.1 MFS transporter [Bryobacteraceae bacterium]HPU73084.1 MFS transporter [Bryobacteraceae bacterium]